MSRVFAHNKEIELASTICPQDGLCENDEVNLSDFEKLFVLGSGGFATVYLVRKKGGKDDGNLYAMKEINTNTIVRDVKNVRYVKAEREILEVARDHSFIVNMHYAFKTPSHLYYILTILELSADYASGGDLFNYNDNNREKMTVHVVRKCIAEIVVAVEELHKLNVLYRDIKMENILICANGHIKITDFNISKRLHDDAGGLTNSYCGTVKYMPPEIVRSRHNCDDSSHDKACDWWSVGVLTYTLMTDQNPFHASGEHEDAEMQDKILNHLPLLSNIRDSKAADFISKLLEKDSHKRLGSGSTGVLEIKTHPFFEDIDWAKLARNEFTAPFKVDIAHPLDTIHFQTFEMKELDETAPSNHENLFKGFPYVAPHLLGKCAAMLKSDHLSILTSQRPDPVELMNFHKTSNIFNDKYKLLLRSTIVEGVFSIRMHCEKKKKERPIKEYTVKILNTKQSTSYEVDALKRCRHPNIVQFIEVIIDPAYTYIVTESFVGRNLLEWSRQQQSIDEKEVKLIFKQLVQGVSYLHSIGIVHRDLQMESVMLLLNGDVYSVKIVDFGFAFVKDSVDASILSYTLDYVAPEVLNNEMATEASDVWSLGVILYTLLCGKKPFVITTGPSKDTVIRLKYQVSTGSFDRESEEWNALSQSASDLITKLLEADVPQRIKMCDVPNHPWMKDAVMNGEIVENNRKRSRLGSYRVKSKCPRMDANPQLPKTVTTIDPNGHGQSSAPHRDSSTVSNHGIDSESEEEPEISAPHRESSEDVPPSFLDDENESVNGAQASDEQFEDWLGRRIDLDNKIEKQKAKLSATEKHLDDATPMVRTRSRRNVDDDTVGDKIIALTAKAAKERKELEEFLKERKYLKEKLGEANIQDNEYEVAKVVDAGWCYFENRWKYHLEWKGFDEKTWEPFESITCPKLVDAFINGLPVDDERRKVPTTTRKKAARPSPRIDMTAHGSRDASWASSTSEESPEINLLRGFVEEMIKRFDREKIEKFIQLFLIKK